MTKRPGEWTGSILITVKDVGLFVTVSQKKWDRAKLILSKWHSRIVLSGKTKVNYKELESDLGFLVHLSMTYSDMKPFLKGFYSTLNGWRPDRDEKGWKLSFKAYQRYLQLGRRVEALNDYTDFANESDEEGAPELVPVLPLMLDHIKVLTDMFANEQPVLLLKRGCSRFEAMYIFGDASGLGFGSSSWGTGERLNYRYGVWGLSIGEDSSSNYRELRNLVESLEKSGSSGQLDGKKVFLFTDNSTAEAIASKGSSTSPLLYELIVRLFKLSTTFLCSIQVIHVSGTMMIRQGTDGLSRGDMLEGVLKGRDMLSYVPLHLSALERDSSLKDWISEWTTQKGYKTSEFLEPSDWFKKGHDIRGYRENIDGRVIPSYSKGTLIWSPPPAAARYALEELRQARHKRQNSIHIFVVPKLMVTEWNPLLYKAADLIMPTLSEGMRDSGWMVMR